MTRRRRKPEYVSPIPEEELSWRMGSSAGRRLEQRLHAEGWGRDQSVETDRRD